MTMLKRVKNVFVEDKTKSLTIPLEHVEFCVKCGTKVTVDKTAEPADAVFSALTGEKLNTPSTVLSKSCGNCVTEYKRAGYLTQYE